MIFLFTWEEKYLLDSQLDNWKQAFIKKYGLDNLYIFNEDNFVADQIANALAWWGLFDEKKFIIIKWFPKDSLSKVPSSEYEKLEKFVMEHIDHFPEENVVVFVSYKPDKRTKIYKFLSSKAQVKEFKQLTEKKLLSYLTEHFPISSSDANYLMEKVWTNLFLLVNEIKKILFVSNKVTKELIDKYAISYPEQDAFKLLDNLDNKEKAVKILNQLEEMKEDFFKILGLLYWNLKNVILITEEKLRWENSKQIANKLWIHSFVASRIYSKDYDLDKIKKMFNELLDLDSNIKTGQIDSSLGYLYLKKIL